MAAQTQLLAKWNNIGRQEAGRQAQMLGERLRDDLGIMGGKVYVDTYEYNHPEYHGVDITIPLGDNDREIRVRIVTDNGPDNHKETLTPRQLEVDLYGDKNMEFFGWSWIYDLDGDMPYDEIFKHAKAALDEVPMEDTHLHPKVKEVVQPLAKWENLSIKDVDTQAQLLGERLRDDLGITGMKVFTDHQDIRDFHRIVITIPTRDDNREIRLNIDTDHTPPLPYEHDKFTIQEMNIGLYDSRRVEPLVSSNIYDLDGDVDVDGGRSYNEIFIRAKAALDEVSTEDYYHHPKRWSFTTPPPYAIVNYDGLPEKDFNTRKDLLANIYQEIKDTLLQRGDVSFKEENVRREVFSGALLVNIPLEDVGREFTFTLNEPITSGFSARGEVSDPRQYESLAERFQVYPSSLHTFEDFQAHLPEHIEDIRQLVNSTISMNRVNNTLKVYDRFIPLTPSDYHFPTPLNYIDEGLMLNRIYETDLQKGLFNGEVNMISTPKEDYIVYAMIGEAPEAKWQFFRETILKDPNSPKIGDRGFEEEYSSIDDLKEAFRKDGIEFVSSESKVVVDNGIIDMSQTTDPVFVARQDALEKIASTVKEGLSGNMGIEVYDDEIEIRLHEDNSADIYMPIGDDKTLDIRLDMEGREGNVLSHAVAVISSSSQENNDSNGIDYFVGPTKEPLEDYSERIYELASTSIRTMRQRELLEGYADDIPLDVTNPNAPKLVNIMGAANENNAVDEDEFEASLLNGEILRAQVDHTDLSFEGEVLIYAEPKNGNLQDMRFNRIGIYYGSQFGHGYTTGITDNYNSIEELKDKLREEGIKFAPKAVLEQTSTQQVVRGSDYYEAFNAGHFNGKYVGKDQVKALREEQKAFVKAHPYGFASEDIETLNKIFPVKLSDQEDGVHLEASAMDHSALTDDVEISVRDQFWRDLFRMVDVVDGNLTLSSTNVESLGNINIITGDLNANDSQLRDLGELREVGGSVSLDNSYVESLGHLEQVGYNTPNDRYLNIGWCPVPMEERLAFMQKLNIQEAVDYGAVNAPYTEEYGLKYIQDHIEQHDQDLDELYALTQTKPNREDWDDEDRQLERDVEIMKKALANVLSKENRERYTKYYVGNDSYLNAIVGVVDRRVNGGNSNVHLTPSSDDSIVSYVFDVRDVPAFGGALYLDFERNTNYGSSLSSKSLIKEVGITLENNNSDLLPKIGAQIREKYSIADNEEFSSDELVSKILSVVERYQTALREQEQEKSLEVEQKTNNVMPPTDSLNTSNSYRIVDVNSPENALKGLDYEKIMDAINSESKNLVAFRVTGDDDLNDLSKRGYEFYGEMVHNVVINLPEVRDNVTTYRFEDGRTLDHLFITAEQMEKVMHGLAYSVSSDEGLVVTDSPRQNPTSEPRVRIQSQDEIFLDDIVDVSTLEEVHDIIDRQVEEALANDLAPWKDAHLETWATTNVNNVAQVEEQSQQVAIQLPLVGAKITINSSIEDLPETSLIVKSVEYNEQSDVYVIKSESGRDDIYMKPDTLRSILENGRTNEQIDEDFYLTYSYSPPLARKEQQDAEVKETQASTQQETQQHVSQIGNAPANRHINEIEYIERVVSGETLYLHHPLDLDDAEFDNILHVDPDRKDADLLTLINRKGERLTVEKLDLLESLFDSSDERILLEFDFSGDMAERIASINRELSEQYKGYTYQTADTSAIRVDEISTYLDTDKLLVAVSDGERTYEDIPFNEFFMSLSQQRMMTTTPIQEEKNDNTLSDEELNAAREFFKNNPRVGIVPPSDFSEPSRYVSYTEVLVTDVRPSTTYHNRYTLEGYMNGSRPQSAYSAIEMTGSQLRKMMAGSKTINAHDEVPTRLKVIFNSHLQDENLIKNSPSDQLQDGTLQYYDISAYSSKSPLVRVVDPQLKTEHVERWDESKLANAIRAHSLTPLYNGDLQNLVYNTYGGEGVDFSLARKYNARGVNWNNLSQENLETSLPLNFKAAMEKVVSDLGNNQTDFPELYGRVSAPTYSHNAYDNGINEIVVGIDVNTQNAPEGTVVAHLDLSYITTPSPNLNEDNAQLKLSFEGGPYKQSHIESVGIEKPSSLDIDPLKGYSAQLKDIASFVRNCDLDLEEQIADQERRSNNLKDFKNSLVDSTIGIYYDDSKKFVEYDVLSIEDKGEDLLLNLGLKDNNSPQLSIPIDKGLGEIAGKSVPDYWETTLEDSSEKIHIVPTQEYRDRFLLYSMIDKPLVATSGEGRDVTIRELVPPQVNPDGSLYRDTTVKYIEDGWHESNAFVHEVADWLRQGAWKEKELPLPLRQYADHLWSDVNTIKLIEKEDSYELYDIDASIANARLGIPLRQVTMKDENGADEVLTVGSIPKEKFNDYALELRSDGTSLQIINEGLKQVNTLSSAVNEDEIRQSRFALMEYVKENIGEVIPSVGNISNQLTSRSDGSVRYQSEMAVDNMLMRVADDYMKIGEDKYLHTAGNVELFDVRKQKDDSEGADIVSWIDGKEVKDFEHNKEEVLSFAQNTYNDWLKQTKYSVSDNGYLNSIIYAVDRRVNGGNSEVYLGTNSDHDNEFILESPKFGNPLYVGLDLRPDGQIEKVDVSLDVTDRDVKLKTGTPIRENYYVGVDERFSLTTLLDKAQSVVEQYQTALKDKEAIVERQKEEYKDILANIKDFNKKGEYQLDNSEFEAALKSDDVFRLNTPDDKVMYFYSKQWEEPIDYEYDYYFRESGEVSPHNFQDLASVQRFLERRGFTFGDGEKVRVSSGVQAEQEESTLKNLSDPEEIAKKLYDSLRGSTVGSTFRDATRQQNYYEGVVSGYEMTAKGITLYLDKHSPVDLTIEEAKKILEDNPSQVDLSRESHYNGALILSSDVMDQYLIGQYVGKPLIPANAEGPWASKEYTIQKYIPLKGGTIEEMDTQMTTKQTKEIFGELETSLANALRNEELIVKRRNLPLELEDYRTIIKDYPFDTVVFVEDEEKRGMFVAFGDDVAKAKAILSDSALAMDENSNAFGTKPNLVMPFTNVDVASESLVPYFKGAKQSLLLLSPEGYGPINVRYLPAVATRLAALGDHTATSPSTLDASLARYQQQFRLFHQRLVQALGVDYLNKEASSLDMLPKVVPAVPDTAAFANYDYRITLPNDTHIEGGFTLQKDADGQYQFYHSHAYVINSTGLDSHVEYDDELPYDELQEKITALVADSHFLDVSVEEASQEVLAEEKPRCHDRNIPEYNAGGDLNLNAKALAIDLAFCATYDNPIALTDKFTEQYGGVRSLLYYNGANKEDFTFTYDTPHGEGFYNKHTIPHFLKELSTLGFKLDKEAFVLPETFTEMGKMRTLAPEVARAGLEEVRVALDGQNLAWKDLNGDGDIDANEVRVLDVSLSTDEKKYILRVEDVNNEAVKGDISIDTAPLLSGVRQHTLKPLVEEEKVLTPEEEEVIALKQYHTQAAEVIATRLESTDDADGYFINKNESSVRNETFLYPSMKSNLLPFSSLLLALASENKNRQTNGYLFFTSAQYNKAHVLAEEKGTIVTVENKDGSRRRATLFNLDQTALQPNDEAQYNKIVADKTGNATDGLKPSVMLEAFREMGVKLRQSADTDIYYDVKRDIINFTPKPESYTPQDKENLLYALVSATGAPSRLSREGLQKNASNDQKRYEELVGVLTVARIAEGERQPMRLPVAFPKDYWVEELRANPEIVERLEKDVNAAHNMVQSILSHRGIELNAQVAEDPTKRFFISDQVKALVDKESQRIVVIADKNTKMADVIVPAGASPNTDGKKEGFDKSLIESALASAEGKYQVQKFYNKQGMYAFNQEDTYFINKEVSLFIQDKGEVTKAATLNIDDAIKNARNAVLEKVQMVRSEDHAEHHTWDMFIKPADGESFLIRPSKEDTHEFFNALHNNKNFENVRLNLGLKYFGIAQSTPEEKKALLEVDTTGMDLNLIKGVREFKAKSGDIYARVTIEGVDSLKPRKVTPEQWQRLYLADDRKEYRKFLAAKLFGDVLRAQTEKVAEEKSKAQLTDEAMKVINRIDDIQKDYPNTYVAFRNKEDGGYDMYQDREKGYVKMFGVDEISSEYVNKNNIPLMLNHANDLQFTSVQEGPLGSRDVILTDLEKEGARDERFYSPDSIWQHLKAQPLAKEDKVFIISSDNRAITYAEDAVKMNERLNRETEDYITHFVPKEKGVEDSYDYLIITKKDGSRFTDEDVNYLYCENRKLDDLKVEIFDYGKYYRAVAEKENENTNKLFTNSLYYKSVDKAVDINRTGFYMAETIYTWQEGKDNYALRINGVQGEEDYLHLVPSLHGKVDDIVIHPTTSNPLFQNVGMRPLSVSIAKNVKVLEFSNVKVTPIEDSVRKQLVETPEIDKWLKAHPTINVTTSLPKTYDGLRASHPEALILFHQTGGYVAFGRDAEEVAKVTGFEPVTINGRSKWEEVKLASFFGNNSLDDILPKLIRRGNRIAVAEWPKEPSEVLQQQDGEMRSLKAPFNNPVEESPSRSSGLHR